MIINGMSIFWITYNPSDLQCLIVLWLAEIRLPMSDSTTSAFKIVTTTMNPIAIATFINEICTAIFNHLLAVRSIKDGLCGLVLTYSGTVETNGRGMLHFHCLVWLKSMINLSNFQQKICGNPDYFVQLIHFLTTLLLQAYWSILLIFL